jgi:hypothetical protein
MLTLIFVVANMAIFRQLYQTGQAQEISCCI